MTSAAASCPSATRALSTERARRTPFASCSACAGCELAAGLIALIDSYRFLVGTPHPEPLYLERPRTVRPAPLSQPPRCPWTGALERRERPGRFGLEGWPAARLREQQQISSHKHPRVDSSWHRPPGQNQGARLVHTQVDVTLARSTTPTHPRSGDAVSWPRSGNSRDKPARRECRSPRPPTQSAATSCCVREAALRLDGKPQFADNWRTFPSSPKPGYLPCSTISSSRDRTQPNVTTATPGFLLLP